MRKALMFEGPGLHGPAGEVFIASLRPGNTNGAMCREIMAPGTDMSTANMIKLHGSVLVSINSVNTRTSTSGGFTSVMWLLPFNQIVWQQNMLM
jgi:hypothetical protein